jgi:hypothetical protein
LQDGRLQDFSPEGAPRAPSSCQIPQWSNPQCLNLSVSHSPPTACRHTVAGPLSLPSQGCFSPFPHGTGSLSVAREYLALRDGPRSFPRDFSCPAVLRVRTQPACTAFVYRALTVSGRSFQIVRLAGRLVTGRPCGPVRSFNPDRQARRFGLFRVRSPLLAESLLFSLPPGTEMVHFPGLSSAALWIQAGISRHDPRGVAPFGHRRVNACLRLTDAYRS